MKLSHYLGSLSLIAFLAACGGPKLDAPSAASLFFEELKKGETQKAFDSADFSFQTSQTSKTFEFTAQSLGMQNATSVVWTRTAVEGKEAKLDGEITKANGSKQQIAVVMVKQDGAWRLHSLQLVVPNGVFPTENPFSLVGKGSGFNDSFRRALPPEKEIRRIVLGAVLNFNDAIQKGDFGDFYKSVSLTWQSQLTEHRLKNAFQGFIDAKVNLEGAKEVQPVFDPAPEINGEGLLVASGYYPTTPNRIVFTMRFIYELPHWKLIGLDINLVKP